MYAEDMRYPQSGGLTAERRTFRERIRVQEIEMFAVGQGNVRIAKRLRVGVRSVRQWRRAWTYGVELSLRSKGHRTGRNTTTPCSRRRQPS
ncbi:helix-turn-helix domain-containing protein [Nocardia brevicatena]|uniref:helix-turn-helix domain-containing protein n=1 Tax=Nocardia brevicatena TaxID=37327 RepID=UPI001C3F33C4